MIEASFALSPARDMIAIDLWEGDPPALPGRTMRVEPCRWWLVDGTGLEAVRAAIAGRGAAAAIGGGMVRATLTGAGWRDLLSVSGFLDTDMLRVGEVASTLIHHVPVRIAVTSDQACEVFFAASYAATLGELWQRAAKGG
ncbi:MAG: sarcosine oxidase subunit gamma [Bradyrhizobium sp.]|nr:sarcosine oxidase subunit gamma [Bradyrhizobium sp.]